MKRDEFPADSGYYWYEATPEEQDKWEIAKYSIVYAAGKERHNGQSLAVPLMIWLLGKKRGRLCSEINGKFLSSIPPLMA